MKLGRLIHTTINGRDQVFPTADFDTLLNNKNSAFLYNLIQPEISFFPDDLALSCTTVIPEFEENGRMYHKTDTIIVKFDHSELTQLLTSKEINVLLQRANLKFSLVEKILSFQSNTQIELNNPLPCPNLNGGDC